MKITNINNSSVQRYSKNSKLWTRHMGLIGHIGPMRIMHIAKDRSAQPHSKISRSEWSVENNSAQQGSKFSQSGIWPMGLMGHIGLIGKENIPVERHSKISSSEWSVENAFAQQDSKFSKSGIGCSTRPSRTADFGTYTRRTRATKPKAISENNSAQPYSKFSKWEMRVLGSLGRLGRRTGMKNNPVEPYSKICKSFENTPAQQHSNISKLKKNQTLHSLNYLHGEMYSAQTHSKNSKWGKSSIMSIMSVMSVQSVGSPKTVL